MANMNAKLVAGLMLVAVLANGAAAKQYTCEEMADRLNEKWMVGSNRFDAGGKTGQEAREALGEWIDSNGILTTRCTPSGYPDVEGPCTSPPREVELAWKRVPRGCPGGWPGGIEDRMRGWG